MKISAIKNSQTFTADIEGQRRKNTFRNIGLGVGTGIVAEKIISKGGVKKFFESGRKELAGVLSEEVSKLSESFGLEELTTKKLRKISHWFTAVSVGAVILGCFVSGSILDWIIHPNKKIESEEV